MKKTAVGALLLGILYLPLPASGQSFSKIIVIGDSLSDTGNLAALAEEPLPLPPDHSNGGRRFSNGPLAVEVFAEALGLRVDSFLTGGTNFAFAGARAGGDQDIDLSAQVAALFSSPHVNSVGKLPPGSLVVFIIGGNDVRDAAQADDRNQAKKILTRALRRIGKSLRRLEEAGAASILMGNVADVGLLPEADFITASGDLGYAARAGQLSREFNRRLAKKIRKNRHRHDWEDDEDEREAKLVLVDLSSMFEFIIANHDPLGFRNTETACFNSAAVAFNAVCLQGDPGRPQFEQFIFFDWFHPTAKVHRIVGQGLFSAIPLLSGGHR